MSTTVLPVEFAPSSVSEDPARVCELLGLALSDYFLGFVPHLQLIHECPMVPIISNPVLILPQVVYYVSFHFRQHV